MKATRNNIPRAEALAILNQRLESARTGIIGCERCERLRTYCKGIGETKRRAYLEHTYWAKPVPGFGDPKAHILILGLAPGAHGANRTGRPFTGDGAGYFMYPVLYEMGLANSRTAPHGMMVYGCGKRG